MSTKILEKLIQNKRYQVAELFLNGKSDEALNASIELDELIIIAMELNMVERDINLDEYNLIKYYALDTM